MRLYIHGGSYNFLYESSGHCVARDLHLLLGVLNRKSRSHVCRLSAPAVVATLRKTGESAIGR